MKKTKTIHVSGAIHKAIGLMAANENMTREEVASELLSRALPSKYFNPFDEKPEAKLPDASPRPAPRSARKKRSKAS